MKFIGIGASPGIALGPIHRFEREDFTVRDGQIPEGSEAEQIARFRLALENSRRDLERIRLGIAAELGEHEAEIYDAQMLMLSDPDLLQAVEEGIRRDHRFPGMLFRNYMSAVAARLESIEDEYLRERRADVQDVERRVLRHLVGTGQPSLAQIERPSVIVAHELGPSDVALLQRDRVLAMVTEVGGRTSHSAIVARGRGIPAVVSVRGILQRVKTGMEGAVDGYSGQVVIEPDAETVSAYRGRSVQIEEESRFLSDINDQPGITLDDRPMELGANIELPSEVDQVLAAGAEAVGLFRTEFFYLGRLELPTEDEQYQAYKGVAERLAPRPVIFRTMDLGGDKVASYLGTTHETNPFLGYRGIRFALSHPDVFRTQLRAIYRASAHGRVRIMFPMVSSQEELTSSKRMCLEVADELAKKGIAHDHDIEIGVMVETPSAVWIADVLARDAMFLSIGSNDLTQYTLAMDRDNERLAHLYEPLNPAVIRSIDHTVKAGHAAGRWVGICGEMAGDPRTAILLLGLGVDELSMSPFDLPRVKAAIRSVRMDAARELAIEALAQPTAELVKALLRDRVESMLPSFLVAKRSPL